MRHGKSAWDTGATSDYTRPLKPRGVKDALRMGALMREGNWRPDTVISSPATRAASTAILAVSAFDMGADAIVFDRRLYDREPGALQEVLVDAPGDTVLVVGHNPSLDELVAWLCSEPARNENDKCLTTAAVAAVTITALHRGGGRLAWLHRPRDA